MKRHLALAGLILFVFGAAWAENDPRIGSWKLNTTKSSVSNGQMPQSETRTYAMEGTEVMGSTEGVNAKGKPISSHYDASADGKERPLGNESSMTISIKETGPGAYAGTIRKDGKVQGTNTAVISARGKVFTFKNKGIDPDGKAYTSTMVYDKQ